MQMGKVGFLDPGFGGLTVLHSVVSRLPLHDTVYLACGVQDQAATKGIDFLLAQHCSIIIITAVRLSQNLQSLTIPGVEIMDVAKPVAQEVLKHTRNGRVGIITRNDTKCAEFFAAEIKQLRPETNIYQQSCPLLVPLIEAGQHHTGAVETVLKGYLTPLVDGGIDVLILGNNHYGVIKKQAEKIVGAKVKVIDEGTAVANALAEYAARHPGVEKQLSRQNNHQFFCAPDAKKAFDLLAAEFYGSPAAAAQVIL